jgi:hypothetical protein
MNKITYFIKGGVSKEAVIETNKLFKKYDIIKSFFTSLKASKGDAHVFLRNINAMLEKSPLFFTEPMIMGEISGSVIDGAHYHSGSIQKL